MSWITRPIHERRRPPAGHDPRDRDDLLVHEFLDSWVCWREACDDVRSAYARWDRAEAPQRALAFESYRAALEREEQAALVHANSTDRVLAVDSLR